MNPKREHVVAMTLLITVAAATSAVAQPQPSQLWPAEAGRAWEFDVSVERPESARENGIVTFEVAERRSLPSGISVACFDVASTLGGALTNPSSLLAVPGCDFDVGVASVDGVALGVWSDPMSDWAWWWTGPDLTPGATFRLPIRTEVQDDAFVNGTVRTITGSVVTRAASFSDAVIVDYVVELGESQLVDSGSGDVLGTATFEVIGWVAFAPGVGPVASEETRAPITSDCAECPSDFLDPVTTRFELRGATPVRGDVSSIGRLKARY